MTDFIHEHPKEEQPEAPSPAAPPEAEPPLDERTGQKRVYGYIFILFVVAFGLLLWSFLMNQRSADQVLSELRGNASTLQTTLDRNLELEQQLRELEARVKELEAKEEALSTENAALKLDKESAAAERETLEQTNAALALLERLSHSRDRGDYDACRALIDQMEAVKGFLPEDAAAHYQEIVEALPEA